MVNVTGLTFTYASTETPALQDIDLHLPPGVFLAVVGANGAGKSSLCFALTGFIPHFYHGVYKGRVEVAGQAVASTPLADLVGDVGLVFQNPFNQITGARLTVREEIAFGLENLGVLRSEMARRVEEVMAIMGLEELAERSPFALSGGQQQRLAIASVVAMRPRLLVLDEPTSQLDPTGTREVFVALRAMAEHEGVTIVLTEHKLEWVAAFADRVVVLAGGRIVADGMPREVLAMPTLKEQGLRQTRYTEAARACQARGLLPSLRPLPITLEQAVEFFQ